MPLRPEDSTNKVRCTSLLLFSVSEPLPYVESQRRSAAHLLYPPQSIATAPHVELQRMSARPPLPTLSRQLPTWSCEAPPLFPTARFRGILPLASLRQDNGGEKDRRRTHKRGKKGARGRDMTRRGPAISASNTARDKTSHDTWKKGTVYVARPDTSTQKATLPSRILEAPKRPQPPQYIYCWNGQAKKKEGRARWPALRPDSRSLPTEIQTPTSIHEMGTMQNTAS